MPENKTQPRTFFLNEKHEFTRGQKLGGGQPPNYAPIDWINKGIRLQQSLILTKQSILNSMDPLRDRRCFMLAAPERIVQKISHAKGKTAVIDEATQYAGEHSRVFRRLGMDLLHVAQDGTAVIHSTPERVEQLAQTALQLNRLGLREQARWATINSFSTIPRPYRIDLDWLDSVSAMDHLDVIVELQPLLTTVEADEVMRAILGFLNRKSNEALVGAGTDFSGRHWYRGRACANSLVTIAEHLFSVEALHRPLRTPSAGDTRGVHRVNPPLSVPTIPATQLPVVAVVDGGVPQGHSVLAQYCRGHFIEPSSFGVLGSHGSFVASRVVFGDLDFSGGVEEPPPGTCRFLDVVVSEDETHINPKSVLPAIEAVVANYPDVRVFNLSFGSYTPLADYPPVERREHLITMRDLDNLIFIRDVIVVVAAGNTREGFMPEIPYPDHTTDQQFRLGSWSMGFNTLTCGSTIGRVHSAGLGKNLDWPSPFTRIGPGLSDAPVPEFGAYGGDCTPNYRRQSPLGVYVCRPDGIWEDRAGTSYAAPLLAREAAFAFQHLQSVCQPGARPFSATVKAYLTLTASRPNLSSGRVRSLADLTIGRGYASTDRLVRPKHGSAVIVWQGILAESRDIARVQIPIPREWLKQATAPRLRLVCAWDSPVHDAIVDVWACRRVNAQLKSSVGAQVLRGSRGKHSSYPLIDRSYDLSTSRLVEKSINPTDDLWIIELSYDEIAEHYPGIEFAPQQRVALAAELVDDSGTPLCPQEFIQKLPIAASMTQLGVPRAHITNPVMIKLKR